MAKLFYHYSRQLFHNMEDEVKIVTNVAKDELNENLIHLMYLYTDHVYKYIILQYINALYSTLHTNVLYKL